MQQRFFSIRKPLCAFPCFMLLANLCRIQTYSGNQWWDQSSPWSSLAILKILEPTILWLVKPLAIEKAHVFCIFLHGFSCISWYFPNWNSGIPRRFSPAPRRISPGFCRAWETRWCHSWWRNNPGKTMEKPWENHGKTNTERGTPTRKISKATLKASKASNSERWPSASKLERDHHLTANQTFPKQGIQTFHISTDHQKS